MKVKRLFFCLLMVQASWMSAAQDQESITIAQQLQGYITSGNWNAWRAERQQLLTMKGEHLQDLIGCLDKHRTALVMAVELLDTEVRDQLKQIRDEIDNRVIHSEKLVTDTMRGLSALSKSIAENDEGSGTDSERKDKEVVTESHIPPSKSVFYHDIAARFITKEREKQEQLWFWQKDYCYERALHIFSAIQKANVADQVQDIQKDIALSPFSHASEKVRIDLSSELQKTIEAKRLVRMIKKAGWKKVYRRDKEKGLTFVRYEKRISDDTTKDPYEQVLLKGIPCTIL